MEKPPQDSFENEPQTDLEQELEKSLSDTWFKTAQELLPGILPNLPTQELSREEKELYVAAYSTLNQMTRDDIVEMRRRKTEVDTTEDGQTNKISRQEYKRRSSGGKREKTPNKTLDETIGEAT